MLLGGQKISIFWLFSSYVVDFDLFIHFVQMFKKKKNQLCFKFILFQVFITVYIIFLLHTILYIQQTHWLCQRLLQKHSFYFFINSVIKSLVIFINAKWFNQRGSATKRPTTSVYIFPCRPAAVALAAIYWQYRQYRQYRQYWQYRHYPRYSGYTGSTSKVLAIPTLPAIQAVPSILGIPAIYW